MILSDAIASSMMLKSQQQIAGIKYNMPRSRTALRESSSFHQKNPGASKILGFERREKLNKKMDQ